MNLAQSKCLMKCLNHIPLVKCREIVGTNGEKFDMGYCRRSGPEQRSVSVVVPADAEEPELTCCGEARAIFVVAAEERSIHNIEDLISTGEYALSVLKKGQILKYRLAS